MPTPPTLSETTTVEDAQTASEIGGTTRIEIAPTGLVSLLGRAAARRFVEAATPANSTTAPTEGTAQ